MNNYTEPVLNDKQPKLMAEKTVTNAYGIFPVSVIISGFCVMSLAYLICFCCCIVQFFVRRNNLQHGLQPVQPHETPWLEPGMSPQKNDSLKHQYFLQYMNSLRRCKQKRQTISTIADSSCVGFCSICFEDYVGDPAQNFVGLIKTCGHFFHFYCIWEWLEAHQTCPLCRGATQLQESDIKGLSLRHVDAYKLCAYKTDNGTENKTTKGSECVANGVESTTLPETAVEATEKLADEHDASDIVVAVDIEGPSEPQHTNCLATDEARGEENVDSCNVTVDSGLNRNFAGRNNEIIISPHDNLAFVNDNSS